MPDYIHGFHESGGEHLMADKPGWLVFTERIFADPNDYSGRDYRQWSDAGFGVIVRLNHDYFPGGTLPERAFYADFAQRVQNFVASSPGAFLWIVGNEPNHEQERPRGQAITAADYAACFGLCAAAIHEVGSQHRAIIAAVAPWNVQSGDWLGYFSAVLTDIENADGICLHTYSHGSDSELVTSMATMDPPYQDRLYHFRAYRDFIARIPPELAHLPLYITETNQVQPWEDINNGWVQAAYQEIDEYNQAAAAYGGSVIHCLTLYRWPNFDQWGIADKTKVHEMFTDAVARGYTVPEKGEPPVSETIDLKNRGFENGWYEYQGVGELKVANDWTPWWHASDTRPEYKLATIEVDPRRIRSGEAAQQWFNTYATHTAGIYQRIDNIQAGRTVRLTGYVQAFTRNDDSDWEQSDGRYRMRIGIDPYGGIDPESEDIIWSQTIQPYDAYLALAVEAAIRSDRLTVFVWGQPEWKLKHNNAYVDDLLLVYADDGTEPPDPPDPPTDGECDLRSLYAALAEAESNLAEARAKNAIMFQELAEGK